MRYVFCTETLKRTFSLQKTGTVSVPSIYQMSIPLYTTSQGLQKSTYSFHCLQGCLQVAPEQPPRGSRRCRLYHCFLRTERQAAWFRLGIRHIANDLQRGRHGLADVVPRIIDQAYTSSGHFPFTEINSAF